MSLKSTTAIRSRRPLALKDLQFLTFLDSAMGDDALGRYSFIAADPFARIQGKETDAGWVARLEIDPVRLSDSDPAGPASVSRRGRRALLLRAWPQPRALAAAFAGRSRLSGSLAWTLRRGRRLRSPGAARLYHVDRTSRKSRRSATRARERARPRVSGCAHAGASRRVPRRALDRRLDQQFHARAI